MFARHNRARVVVGHGGTSGERLNHDVVGEHAALVFGVRERRQRAVDVASAAGDARRVVGDEHEVGGGRLRECDERGEQRERDGAARQHERREQCRNECAAARTSDVHRVGRAAAVGAAEARRLVAVVKLII